MMIDPYTWMQTLILDIRVVASDTVAVRVAKPDGYDFSPGQYSIIRAKIDGTPLMRQYSFSSAPTGNYLEFIIRRLPGGSVSSWFLDQAKTGDLIEITKPYGRFAVEIKSGQAVYVAGGVGIAPFVSLLRTRTDDTTLIYSERTLENVILDKEISKLLGDKYSLVLSGETGRINATLFSELWDTDSRYYLCGSKQFVDSIANLLAEHGVDKSLVHREAFTLQ